MLHEGRRLRRRPFYLPHLAVAAFTILSSTFVASFRAVLSSGSIGLAGFLVIDTVRGDRAIHSLEAQ